MIFRLLNLRPAVRHKVRLILLVTVVAGATGLMGTVLLVFGSLHRSVEDLVNVSGSADLEVAARTSSGVPASDVSEVGADRGVDATTSVVRTEVVVGHDRATLIGFELSIGQFLPGSADGCASAFTTSVPHGVVIGPGLPDSSSVSIVGLDGRERIVPVSGRLQCQFASRINGGHVIVTDIANAAELSGRPGHVDSLLVLLRSKADVQSVQSRLQALDPQGIVVRSPAQATRQVAGVLIPVDRLLASMSLLAVLLAGLLVFNALSLAFAERSHELGVLRAIGASRRRVLVGMTAEAAIIGITGVAGGVGVAVVATPRALQQVPDLILGTIGVRPTYYADPSTLLFVAAVALGTCVIGGLIPAWGAVRRNPVDVLSATGYRPAAAGTSRRHLAVLGGGLATIVAGVVLGLRTSTPLTIGAVSVVEVGFAVTLLALEPDTTGAAARLASVLGGPGRSAASSIRSAPRRSSAGIVAVALATSVVISMAGALSRVSEDVAGEFNSMRSVDVWVQTPSVDQLPVGVPLDPQVASAVETLPGVTGSVAGRALRIARNKGQLVLYGVDGPSELPLFAAASEAERGEVLADRGVVVNRRFAEVNGVRAGDQLHLPTPSGDRVLRIVAVEDAFVVSDEGAVVAALDSVDRWFGTSGPTWLEMRSKPGGQEVLQREVAARLGDAAIPVEVMSGADAARKAAGLVQRTASVLNLVVWAVVVGSAVVLLNTILTSVLAREREHSVLRTIGMSIGQLRAAVLIEAAVVAGVGSVLGACLGVVGEVVMLRVVGNLLGVATSFSLSLDSFALAIGMVIGVVLVAGVAPARRLGRIALLTSAAHE